MNFSDENMSSRNLRRELMNCISMTISSASKKKILAKKNDAAYTDPSSGDHLGKPSKAISRVTLGLLESHDSSQHHSAMVCRDQSLLTSNGSKSSPYDPLTNYMSPRPQFLRYNPNKRREILLRIEGELEEEENGSELSIYSESKKIGTESSMSCASSETYFQDKEFDETKEMEDSAAYHKVKPKILWKMILLLGALFFLFYFPVAMNTRPRHRFDEYRADTESYEKISDLEIISQPPEIRTFSVNVLWALMDLSDVCLNLPFKESACGIDTESYENVSDLDITSQAPEIRTFSVNDMWTLMGLSDVCLDVPFKESACGIDSSHSDSIHVDISIVTQVLKEEAQFEKTEPLRGNNILPVNADMLLEKVTWEDQKRVTIDGDVLVLEENMHQPNVSGEFITQSKDSGITLDFAYKWIADYETTKFAETHNSEHLMVNSPDYGYLDDQAKVSQPHGSLNPKHIPSEKPQYPGIAEAVDDQKTRTWKNMFMFTSLEDFQLLFVLICFSSTVIGLGGLCKYYLRSPNTPVPSSLLSSPAIASQVAGEGKNGLAVSRQQLNVCSMPLTQPIGSANNVMRPIVELLNEFSISEKPDFGKDSILTPKEREGDSMELSKLSQHQRRLTRNGISSSTNKILISPSETSVTNSILNRSSAVRKALSKEEAGERVVVAEVPTPLRRSARIRSRVTSP